MLRILSALFVSVASAVTAQQTEEEQFIWDNLTGTFYHELAHALVDQFEIPIYGQEEDAADVFAAFMIAKWHKPTEARRIARAVAIAFYSDYHRFEDRGEDVYWAGVHGPALQRMYNHLCVFIGSNPTLHRPLGEAFEMDPDRLDYCGAEFHQANAAWGPVLDRMERLKGVGTVKIEGFSVFRADVVGKWATRTMPRLDPLMGLPADLPVRVEPCRQSNAFYDSGWNIIQMCIEQSDAHREQFREFGGVFQVQ